MAWLGINPTRHGWNGWLSTQKAIPIGLLDNFTLQATVVSSIVAILREEGQLDERLRWLLESGLDPNDWRLVRENSTGIRYLPLTTQKHARTGSRERVLDVADRCPKSLRIVMNALATRVLFDENNRAIGVEYLQGENLYRAHAAPSAEPGDRAALFASREVILAAGAFNTPQLLMLSGVGDRETLDRFGIPVVADLAGVGRNLQDRYEIGVVNRMNFKAWAAYKGAQFNAKDPQYRAWFKGKSGVYASNGSALTLFRRSPGAGDLPDQFCMSLLARFSGYRQDYSFDFRDKLNYFTWVVLKAHTRNRAGEVTLRSSDPRDTPLINFRYFQEGGDEDLAAVVDGIRFVRRLSAKLKKYNFIDEAELPGERLQSDDELCEFVRRHAWGHHASCTCAIGPIERNGVLASDFRVHGVRGLRVVDASVFPRIPGFFIASAIYMIGEKAAEVILSSRD